MSQTNGALVAPRGQLLAWNGEKRTAYAWAQDPRVQKLGLTGTGIAFRVKRGWTDEEALTTPKGETPPRIAAETPRPHGPARGTKLSKPRASRSAPPSSAAEEVRATLTALDPVELLRRLGWDVEELGETPVGRVVVVKGAAS